MRHERGRILQIIIKVKIERQRNVKCVALKRLRNIKNRWSFFISTCIQKVTDVSLSLPPFFHACLTYVLSLSCLSLPFYLSIFTISFSIPLFAGTLFYVCYCIYLRFRFVYIVTMNAALNTLSHERRVAKFSMLLSASEKTLWNYMKCYNMMKIPSYVSAEWK